MGQSANKTPDLRGTAELFSVHSPAWEMTIAHNRWSNGDRDIVLYERRTAPQQFDRFRSARRLGLTPVGTDDDCYVELMQAQIGERDQPNTSEGGTVGVVARRRLRRHGGADRNGCQGRHPRVAHRGHQQPQIPLPRQVSRPRHRGSGSCLRPHPHCALSSPDPGPTGPGPGHRRRDPDASLSRR
jgi:hypothetical protein